MLPTQIIAVEFDERAEVAIVADIEKAHPATLPRCLAAIARTCGDSRQSSVPHARAGAAHLRRSHARGAHLLRRASATPPGSRFRNASHRARRAERNSAAS